MLQSCLINFWLTCFKIFLHSYKGFKKSILIINNLKFQAMDYRNMTAPCGKDCFNCPLYTGEENFLVKQNIVIW